MNSLINLSNRYPLRCNNLTTQQYVTIKIFNKPICEVRRVFRISKNFLARFFTFLLKEVNFLCYLAWCYLYVFMCVFTLHDILCIVVLVCGTKNYVLEIL